jgi:hypothetical protein
VAEILDDEGRQGLEALPAIGRHLAYTIEKLVRTGEFRTVNGDDELASKSPPLIHQNSLWDGRQCCNG